MKLFTFMGASPAEALKKAQSACGSDAIVVSTKELKKKSLNSTALYEVVVAIEEEQKKVSPPQVEKEKDQGVVLNLSNQAKKLSPSSQRREPIVSQIKEETNSQNFKELQESIQLLNQKINNLQEILWEEKGSKKDDLIIPPEFAKIYNITKKSGMDKEHIDEIMKNTLKHMPPYMKSDPKAIERYFSVLLKKMIGIRVEKELDRGEKKIIMLVGPTGVGKTTTLAKLAARYSFVEYNYKVGLISLDSYRIGAHEQLLSYASMMKLPLEEVIDSQDFIRALNTLSYCDVILIDTVGSSQYDKDKIYKIAKLVESTNKKIDVNLVVAAPTKLEDLREIYQSFSLFKLDTLVVTKFDETNSFGNVFSLALESSLAFSYFSMGQEVPDDLSVANSDFLIECILDGYKSKEVVHA